MRSAWCARPSAPVTRGSTGNRKGEGPPGHRERRPLPLARTVTTPTTVSPGRLDPANDDARWARHAAGYLPRAEELVLPPSDAPNSFAGHFSQDDELEAPHAWTRTKAVAAYVAWQLAARGVGVHLGGHGGDELFSPAPSFFHALGRSRPLGSIPRLWVARSMYRWPVGTMLRNLPHNPSYRQGLNSASRSLTTPVSGPREPLTGWGYCPRLPSWVTAPAVDACRGMLQDAAKWGIAPHSPDPAQHEITHTMRQCGTNIRLRNRRTSRSGVAYHAVPRSDASATASPSPAYPAPVKPATGSPGSGRSGALSKNSSKTIK
ncbi:asparagine synthase-related protein [Streptomyces scopuliridis]|uniref:asparagine synthase-related protein n=1 Tax=Streptomyces scopuliridis TaxID=452529 RepID=UPI003F56957F